MATPIADLIVSRVRLRIAEPYTGMLQDSDIEDFINEAQDDLLWRLPYPAMWFATERVVTDIAAGQDTYTFEGPDEVAPSVVMVLLVEWNGRYAKKLEVEDLRKFSQISDVSPDEEQPQYYLTSSGINFMVGAGNPADIVSDGIAITYIKRPDPVDLDVTDLGYPEAVSPLIEDFVAARGYENRRNADQYGAAMESYYERIDRIKERYQIGEDVQQYMSKVDRP